jgi:FixJ family two-component response regulator
MESVIDGCKAIFGAISGWFALRLERSKRAGEKKLQILALMPHGQDSQLLRAVARDAGLFVTLSDTATEIVFRRHSDVPSIVILDPLLFPDRWKGIIWMLTRNSPRPYVILLSPTADANLWDELQRVGGSDILRFPIRRDTLIEALERAGQIWRNQQEAHGPLQGT